MEQSKVYRATSVEDDKKLYELTSRMKLQAEQLKNASKDGRVQSTASHGDELAGTVLEFLEVSGWSRS